MGEFSKRIGEAGEALIQDYLKLIGWTDTQKGVSISCVKPEKHMRSSSPRVTHGIDFLYTYVSPLVEGVQKNVVVSVKFTNDEYPDNPAGLFRSHFKDLAQTIQCFKHSPDRQSIIAGGNGVKRSEEVGVLFWISNSKQSYIDVISRVSNVPITEVEGHAPIYLVDRKRAAFVFDSLMFARRSFEGSEIEFYYFDTGNNTNPLLKHHNGSVLPVEFINSSILPMRVSVKGTENTVLMLFSIDEFSQDGLKLLVGMAQRLSGNWASKIMLCFPDYSALNHSNIVQGVKATFSDKKTTRVLEVYSYASDFLTLQG